MKTTILNHTPLRGIVSVVGLSAALLLTADVSHARGAHRGHGGGVHRGHHRTSGHRARHRTVGGRDHHRGVGRRSHHRRAGHTRRHHTRHPSYRFRYYGHRYSFRYSYSPHGSNRYTTPSHHYRTYPYSYRGSAPDGTARARQTRQSSRSSTPYAADTPHEYSRGDLTGSGWVHLREGRPAKALDVFAREAPHHPSDGAIKVGYALATAARGDRSRGAWAMRRALLTDPNALHYIHLDDKLRPLVRRLISAYAHSPPDTFMLAALHYLLRDGEAARKAIHQASGDRAASTKNLARLIGEMPGAKKVPYKTEDGARMPERKKDAKPATRESPDDVTTPPRKRGSES